VWPPDSTPTGNNQGIFPYNPGYDVHRVSQRSLAGVESIATTISPYVLEYYTPSYPDSVRYIIVNGDTAYRHPFISLPPVYDSAVPFHVDGSANFVTLVYSSLSITDTSYENGLTAQITSPKYGDTVLRSNDMLVGYETYSSSTASLENSFLTITDSALSYSQSTDNDYTGALDFPSNDLESLQGRTVWVDLHLTEEAYNEVYTPNYYDNYYEFYREVDVDRIVAYPLH
jgi:hypothetical protein